MSKKQVKNLIETVNLLDNQIGKEKYIERISRGNLTKTESPKDHFIVALAVYDLAREKIFIGHHKKSDRWIFPGGHIEKGETLKGAAEREMEEELGLKEKLSEPFLLTKTPINNSGGQKCQLHYDVWFFVPADSSVCIPEKDNYSTEYFEAGWKTFEEARRLIIIPSYLEPIDYIERYLN